MNKPGLPVSTLSLRLPTAERGLETYRLAASRVFPAKLEGPLSRVAFSAAHVVTDPYADVDPWLSAAVDWDRTIAFREHIWDLGLGVAEAMDTAQRGMGMDWPTSLELITRSVAAARARGNALVFSGGIGENAFEVRERICAGLGFLGIKLDSRQNATSANVISVEDSRVTVHVIRTDEEWIIAKTVLKLLTSK